MSLARCPDCAHPLEDHSYHTTATDPQVVAECYGVCDNGRKSGTGVCKCMAFYGRKKEVFAEAEAFAFLKTLPLDRPKGRRKVEILMAEDGSIEVSVEETHTRLQGEDDGPLAVGVGNSIADAVEQVRSQLKAGGHAC